MMRLKVSLLYISLSLFIFSISFAQQAIISGPMIGQVEMRTAAIWLEVYPDVNSIQLKCWKSGSDKKSGQVLRSKGSPGNDFNPVIFQIGGLDHKRAMAMAKAGA
jgi:alkaline phosphatase D